MRPNSLPVLDRRSKLNPRIILALLCCLLVLTGRTQAVTPVDPSDPNILYTGRWNDSNPSQPLSYWIGTSIIARFEGTSIAATCQAGNTDYFRIIVDDDATNSTKIPVGSSIATYTLASGLADAVHKIEIVKETDIGTWTFLGFELEDGKSLVAPPARPSHKIQFYGDSNLAGHSLESEQNESGAHLRGSYYGYAGIVSRMLDAEYHNVSRSGATISSLHNVYDRFIYGSPNPTWNFDDFPADVVLVNLGANDVGRPKQIIKNNYHAFLDDLRSVYPSAHIMLFNAWGWDYDEPANYTHEVISEHGDSNMSYQVFPWLFEQWHGCEYDHSGMAAVLADHLSSIMGWSKNPADVMNGFGRNGDVANGSFEEAAPFGGYGWRYYTDSGVSRVHAPTEAFDEEYYLRLSNGAASHQPIPAVGGETFTVTAWMRGRQNGDEINITMDFRDQEMWTTPLQTATETRTLTTGWQQYSMTAAAPTGTPNPVFHIRVTFTAAVGDSVDIDAVTIREPTGVMDSEISPPVGYRLSASPNPFNPVVRIAYRISQSGPARLTVYDISGRRVATLVDEYHEAGEFVTKWNGLDDRNTKVSSGIYFLRITADDFTATEKLVILR
jgi:hypothetical protein